MLIDVRFVASRWLEVLQICTPARSSHTTHLHSHLHASVLAALYRDGAVLIRKRRASDSSCLYTFTNGYFSY